MAAFEVLLLIVLLVLVIILMGQTSGITREMATMRKQMGEFMKDPSRVSASSSQQAPVVRAPLVPPPPVVVPPPAPPSSADDAVRSRIQEAFPEKTVAPPVAVVKPVVVEAPKAPPPFQPPPPPRQTFYQRHPDLEKFIGENLINKIGIAVFVLGIGLLLNYAIGKGLLSTTAQTLIGLGTGALLVFFAHRLRVDFRAFSSVLVAGGIAVFYTTIAIAFHKFQLIGQVPAFAIMVGITALAVALTLGYDRKELAVISLLGGFAAPFLAASGDGNYKVLFTYLLILDVGMLVLASYKKWHIINVISFVLSMAILVGWSVTSYADLDPRPATTAFGFAAGFFLVFFAMNLRYNLKNKQAFSALDHTLLLANTGAFYGVGLHFLSDLSTRVTGLFTVLLGVFYLAFALYFHKREAIPRPLKLLLIGLVLTFISLAAPVQLSGSNITLFWAAEAVLLLWFAHRTDLKLVERGSVIVTLLMFISLGMDMGKVYGWGRAADMQWLLNKGWITGMCCVVSLGASMLVLGRAERSVPIVLGMSRNAWRHVLAVLGVLVLYTTNLFELTYQLGVGHNASVLHQAQLAYTLLFVLALEIITRKQASWVRSATLVVILFGLLLWITAGYSSSRTSLYWLTSGEGGRHYLLFHYAGLFALAALIVRLALLMRALLDRSSKAWNAYLWSVSLYLVILGSQELDVLMVLAQNSTDALRAARRVGYPILWGAGSFVFMWYGMRTKLRTMRIIALSLFAVTLLKLFLFDIWDLSEGGRVAAFIFLGALLLVISFMYQKLKGLIVDGDTEKKA